MEFRLPINKYKNTDVYLGFPLYVLNEFQRGVANFPYTSRDYKLYTAVLLNNIEFNIPEGEPSILRDQYCSYMEEPEVGVRLYPNSNSCTIILMMYLKEYTYNQVMYFQATEDKKTKAINAIYNDKPLSEKGSLSDEISSTLTRDINAFNYPFTFFNLPTKAEVEMIQLRIDKLKSNVVGYDSIGNEITEYDEVSVIMVEDPNAPPTVPPTLMQQPINIDFHEIRNSQVTNTLQHLHLQTLDPNFRRSNFESYLSSISNYEIKYGNYSTTIESKLSEIINKYVNGELNEEIDLLEVLRDSNLVEEVESEEEWPTDSTINSAIAAFPGAISSMLNSLESNIYWNNI